MIRLVIAIVACWLVFGIVAAKSVKSGVEDAASRRVAAMEAAVRS